MMLPNGKSLEDAAVKRARACLFWGATGAEDRRKGIQIYTREDATLPAPRLDGLYQHSDTVRWYCDAWEREDARIRLEPFDVAPVSFSV